MRDMSIKQKRRAFIGASLLIVFIITGIMIYSFIQANKDTDLNIGSPVVKQDNRMDFFGEVKFEKVYDIIIDFPSAVTDVKVKEGEQVVKGQTLVTMDISEYLGAIDKLQQQLAAGQAGQQNTVQPTAALEADIAQLQKDVLTKTGELNNGTNADLKILKTSLALAEKQLETAKKDVKNNQELFDTGAVSKSTLDQYIDIMSQREKSLNDVKNNIEKTKSLLRNELDQLNISLKSKREQLNQIGKSNSVNTTTQNSSVAVSKIDLDIMKNKSIKDYLSTNKIISCVQNGIVQNIEVVNGTRLGTQNTPTRVLQLIDADSIVVSAEVDEEYIKNVKIGETVNIVPVSDSSLSIQGTVTQISNIAVEKDGKRIIKVQVKPMEHKEALKPGYSVDVYIPKK